MTIASRTPEGFPSHCPLCGHATEIEYSDPGEDAVCPKSGQLIHVSSQLLERLRVILARHLCVAPEIVTGETKLPLYRDIDSLDAIELMMSVESEFGAEFTQIVPIGEIKSINTVGDLLRCILQRLGGASR